MRSLQLVLGGIVVAVWCLSRAARRYPHVSWLQPFANAFPSRPPRRKAAPRNLEAYIASGAQPRERSPFVGPAVASVREAHVQRSRQRGQVYTGLEMILFGIVIPPGYVLLEMMMFFSETTTLEWLLVGGASLLFIGLGIAAIVTSRRT